MSCVQRKKILHIQVLPKLSGVQRVSLEILRHIPNDDYEKYILFGNDTVDDNVKMQCINEFEKYGINVLFSKNLYRTVGIKDIPAFIEIYILCKSKQFDIVHTHSTKPGIIGRIAATFAKTPLVIHTVHGLAFHKYIGFPMWQFYWVCEMIASFFCTKIVSVNNNNKKYFRFFRSKFISIYNGIDFDILGFNKNKADIEKINILFVGRLDTQKDPLTLLQAAKEVIKEDPNICFTLVGDGEKYKDCKKFINGNHLEKNIFLAGWQNDVTRYYRSSNIFMASSIYEAMPLMFIEAGYFKLPVVATNVEGVPEVVEDKVTGLLSPPREPHLLAQNVLYLIRNEEQRKCLGENGHKRVTTLFSSERMVEKYNELYQGRICTSP